MKRTKTWAETWGKISSDDDWSGWDGLTAEDIDKMVADGADVNEMHVYALENTDPSNRYPKPIAKSTYPLERAITLGQLGACKALIKHGAAPQQIFYLFENGQKEYESILEGPCLATSPSNVRYLIEELKVPVTPKAILSAIKQGEPLSLQLLLDHFDLKGHPALAKKLLKENLYSGYQKKLRMKVQSIVLSKMKNGSSKNTQNSKVTVLKSARINSGR